MAWTFDYTGNLTLANNLIATSASPEPTIQGFSFIGGNISSAGNVTAGNFVGSASANIVAGNKTWKYDNVSIGGSRITFPDGTSNIYNAGSVLSITGPSAVQLISGTNQIDVDTAQGTTITGNFTSTGKIGYANGGAVTQSGTGQGVTVNQLTGEITLAKSSWNAGDLEAFILQTNKVSNNDYILAQLINSVYVTSFAVSAYVYSIVPNSIMINVKALEAVTSTPTVKFFIMKAPVA
jgi:hypothetical protein